MAAAHRLAIVPLTGWVAEWLCSGLQSRVRRFDSALSLQYIYNYILSPDDIALDSNWQNFCVWFKTEIYKYGIHSPDGEIGRRKGLKIPRWKHRAGSTPAPGTICCKSIINSASRFLTWPSSLNHSQHRQVRDKKR